MQANPAIVLKSTPWREIDRLVTLFTRDYGKVRGIARGGSRSRKRFGGTLDPLTHVQVHFRTREQRDLVQIELCEEIEMFPQIRMNLSRFGNSFYFVELTDSLFPERESNPEVFELLLWGLARLNAGDNPLDVSRKFEVRVIDLAGYRPKVWCCRVCGKAAKTKGTFFFLTGAGEIVCSGCGGGTAGKEISGESLAVLHRMPRLGWSGLNRLRISPRVSQELEGILSDYLAHFIPSNGEFRSRMFLNSVRREDEDDSIRREVEGYE